MSIKIEISLGEFLDKLTILEIKKNRINDPEKLVNINRELDTLMALWTASKYSSADIAEELTALRAVNEKLWDIEDRIRDKEAAGEFDEEFTGLARSVYFTNDKRASLKRQINVRLGSELVEEKSYRDYSQDIV